MRVVLTGLWENGHQVSSLVRSLRMAICQAHKLPKTHLESVTGKGGPIICGVDNLIGVDKKGGSTNSANFACAVSKQQVAGEEPSFPAEGLSENKRQRQNNLQEASAGRT